MTPPTWIIRRWMREMLAEVAFSIVTASFPNGILSVFYYIWEKGQSQPAARADA